MNHAKTRREPNLHFPLQPLRWRRTCFLFLLPVLLITANGCPPPTEVGTAGSYTDVRSQMEQWLVFLDSSTYAASVSWEEHVVLVYRLAKSREPTAIEFVLFRALRDELGLKRSDILSFALGGETTGPTWEQCRQFLDSATLADFQPDPAVTAAARKLALVSLESAAKSLDDSSDSDITTSLLEKSAGSDLSDNSDAAGQSYSTYFGDLHAHSELSDGRGTPLEAYTYARDVGDLDFFALTDHGEFLVIWPWSGKWAQLKAAANATNEDGRFAALWGFEWGSPAFGHITVLNTADFTDCIRTLRLRRMYNWILARPKAFAQFNHPGEYGSDELQFLHFFPPHPVARQMVGVELFNEDRGFDQFYYSGSWSNSFSYWDVGNRNGWRFGALGGQDTHDADWGTRDEFRTAVLAEELTRDAIAEAYRARRFYATEDKNLYLDFRCQGYPMGARLRDVTREFEVTASDAGGDGFQEVRLYRDGVLVDAASVSGNTITATFSDTTRTAPDYYYVIVTQTDDNDSNGRCDEAISSPIWILD